MRHGKKINHLGRTSSHRKAMLSNMASSLILHKRISTTLAKAKALRTFVEPLFTRSKDDSTHNRRMVFSYLQNKEAVSELFREISKKISERPGGYTRILKTGNRLGDNADMCIIELVDYNLTMLAAKETAKAKPTRRRRAAGKKKDETAEAPEKATAVDEVKEPKAKKSTKKAVVEEVKEPEETVDKVEEPSEPEQPKEETPESKEE
jgi:large subunit ribosomal protein L17